MSLNLLVLGGTSWLGGTLARRALERGHRVTCLARGESGSAPGEAEWVRADRWQGHAYDDVARRQWDAVLDVSWQPELVRSALAALAGHARHWLYVSSGSVYADDSAPDAGESAPLLRAWTGPGKATMQEYGPAKVSCETACRETVPATRLLVARAGLIAGHGDRSDRFGYWPARLSRATESSRVLVPPQASLVQVIDVLDLADWMIAAVENATSGVFNAVGDIVAMRDVLAACQFAAETNVVYAETDQAWLLEHEVAPWAGPESLPLWLPIPEYAGFMTRRNQAAKESGLRLRPLADTVQDALVWERELGLNRVRRAGVSPKREAELLAAMPRA